MSLSTKIAKVLSDNEGLSDALNVDHYIIRDIAGRFFQYGSLSEKQIALVLKIARERAERAAEPQIEITEGHRTMTGKVLSAKLNRWETPKMLLKLDTGEKVWGTVPTALLYQVGGATIPRRYDRYDQLPLLKGRTVTVTAKVEKSRNDPCFGIFKRPKQDAKLHAQTEVA